MIAHERAPALRRHTVARSSVETRRHVLADSTRRDPQAEFEAQFVGDAPLAPCKIVARHLTDERLQLSRNWGPSRARWPPPEQAEPLAPPPPERLRLHHRESLLPVEPLRQPDQGEASGVGGVPWLDMVFLIQRQLLTQEPRSIEEQRAEHDRTRTQLTDRA
jgi:hypothetical protein